MNAKQIRKATNKMTFEQANNFIENLGLQLELQQNYPYLKSWSVKNNNEIYFISNSTKYLNGSIADVKFCFSN